MPKDGISWHSRGLSCGRSHQDSQALSKRTPRLDISELRRGLGRVSNLNLSINWHRHIKGHVEIGYLTKFGPLRLNRDPVMTLETWLKIHTNVCIFVTGSPQNHILLIFFTTSVIFLKMGKHSDFRIRSFQVVDAWRILQFNRKTENYFKELI